MILVAAETTRAVPITGAIATSVPSNCSGASPAAPLTRIFTSHEVGAASSVARAARRTSMCDCGSRPDSSNEPSVMRSRVFTRVRSPSERACRVARASVFWFIVGHPFVHCFSVCQLTAPSLERKRGCGAKSSACFQCNQSGTITHRENTLFFHFLASGKEYWLTAYQDHTYKQLRQLDASYAVAECKNRVFKGRLCRTSIHSLLQPYSCSFCV